MKFNINLDEDFDLKFSCHTIHVKFVDKTHSALQEESDNISEQQESVDEKQEDTNEQQATVPLFGCYIGDEFTIYVRKVDPYSIRLSTFLHELIHVIEQIYTLDLDHKELNLISEVMTQVLYDNFGLGDNEGEIRKDGKR